MMQLDVRVSERDASWVSDTCSQVNGGMFEELNIEWRSKSEAEEHEFHFEHAYFEAPVIYLRRNAV